MQSSSNEDTAPYKKKKPRGTLINFQQKKAAMEHIIPKPPAVQGYPTHRLVVGLTRGMSALHVDEGHQIRIRTDTDIPTGELRGFSLRACVSYKNKGRHRYFPTNDWRSRHLWLERKGEQHGFEVITVHSTAQHFLVEKSGGKFTIDDTQFTGVLKITNAEKFASALASGIGKTGRAFGFGLLLG